VTAKATARPAVPDRPQFVGTATPPPRRLRTRMTNSSWRPDCPTPLEDLRLLQMTHWGFDGDVHTGHLVVHESVDEDVIRAFRMLFRSRFPIERMQLVDAYKADDDRSMAANNTSAFNCRVVSGTQRWSQHAYGTAIDINPVQNPWVSGDVVQPPAGAQYVDRRRVRPGMIVAGDAATTAFASIGWRWGGAWQASKDYQHFSASGS
jgi:hypothetical protein